MPSFNEQMVAKFEALLLENAGVQSVTIDGNSVAYTELEERYQFWKKRVQAERGTRPTLTTIKMGGT